MKLKITNFQPQTTKKGVSIYLALMITFVLLAISLGVSLIIVSQMKMMKGMGDSVIAFYAADTGIEESLYKSRQLGDNSGIFPDENIGEAKYLVNFNSDAAEWDSVGSYKEVKRAIKITTLLPLSFAITVNPGSYCYCAVLYEGVICPVLSNVITVTITTDPSPGTPRTFYFSYYSPKLSCSFSPADTCEATYPGSCGVTLDCIPYFTTSYVDVTITDGSTKSMQLPAQYSEYCKDIK